MTLQEKLETAITAMQDSKEWRLYRDHEKRELAFLAGLRFGVEILGDKIAPLTNQWDDTENFSVSAFSTLLVELQSELDSIKSTLEKQP